MDVYVKYIAAALILLLASCQAPMQSGFQCVVESGFLPEESQFSWRTQVPLDVDDKTGYISPLIVGQIEEAARMELVKKGVSYVDRGANADLEVSLTLRTRRELVAFETSGSVCRYSDCWERIDMGSETRMETRTIGFLASDIYYQGEPIWRGWVETSLFPKDRDAANEVISRAIPELYKSFPP